MENINNIIGIAQWSIFILVITLHFLLGFKRGTKKSLYYTLSSIVITGVLLFGLSFVSISVIFTPGRLLQFVDIYFKVPDNIREYLVNPELSPYVFAIIDLVLRLVMLLVLYPVVKFFITYFISRPIWKVLFAKGHKKARKNKEIILGSRALGGILGAFRGFLVVFVLFMPFIVFSGVVSNFEGNNNNSNLSAFKLLNTENEEDSNTTEGNLDILKTIQSFNNEGIGLVVKKIKIGDKSADEAVFDLVFSAKIKNAENEETKLEFARELNLFGEVAQVLIKDGYLSSSFDINAINYEDDFENINLILNNLGDSQLVNLLIPVAIDVLEDQGTLDKMLGYDVSENNYTKTSFQQLRLINWKQEMDTISAIVERLLLIDSVGGLTKIASNPKDVLGFDLEKREYLTEALEAVTDLQMLVGTNIAIEYLLQDQKNLDKITWVDKPYEYAHEKLNFIFANSSYFKGEDGALRDITNIVSTVFSEEHQEYDFSRIVSGQKIKPEMLLEEDTAALAQDILQSISDIELLMKAIPVGIDYFTHKNNITAGELADSISNLAYNADFKLELENINGIYEEVLKLGLEAYLGGKPNILNVANKILSKEGSFETVKNIVDAIFTDSEFINETIKLASKPLAEKLIKEENIKAIVLNLVTDEEFKLGKELTDILNLTEQFYEIKPEGKIKANIKSLEVLAKLNEEEFASFRDGILNLQIMKNAGVEAARYAKVLTKTEYLQIPDNATSEGLNSDLTKAFNLLYDAAKEAKAKGDGAKLKDIINFNKLPEVLKFDKTKDKDSILLYSLVNFLKTSNYSLGEMGTLQMPEVLMEAEFSSDTWINEINSILDGAVTLSTVSKAEDVTILKLSDVVGVDSIIINSLITNQLVNILPMPIPSNSFEGNTNILKLEEIENLIEAMKILVSEETPVTQITFNGEVTLAQFNDLLAIDDSPLITRLISSTMLDAMDSLIPDSVKVMHEDGTEEITHVEMQKLVSALIIGYGNDLKATEIGNAELGNLTIANIEEIVEVSSVIVNGLITTQIEEMLTITIPSNSYSNDPDILLNTELNNLIDAMKVLNSVDTKLTEIKFDGDITLAQFNSLLEIEDSPLITRLISDVMITTLDISSIPVSVQVLHEDGIIDIKNAEMQKLVTSFSNVFGTNFSVSNLGNVDFEDITINEIQTLNSGGSEIIRIKISNAIIASEDNGTNDGLVIPTTVYETDGSIKQDELDDFFMALVEIDKEMNGPDSNDSSISDIATGLADETLVTKLYAYLVIASDSGSEILEATINNHISRLLLI